MCGHDRLDPRADGGEEVAVVDAGQCGRPGGDAPHLLSGEVPDDPHVVEARKILLELAGGDRLGRLAAETRPEIDPGEERGCREHPGHAGEAGERLPHLLHHVEALCRPDGRIVAESQHHLDRHERADRPLDPGIVADHRAFGGEERVDAHRCPDPGNARRRHGHRDRPQPSDRAGVANHEGGTGILDGGRPWAGVPGGDRPPFEDSRHDQKEHRQREHDADRGVEAEDPDRLELAHHQRRQADRGRAGRQAAGEPAEADRTPGDPRAAPDAERVDEVIREVDATRDAEREHEHRHDDENRIHPIAAGGEAPEVEADTGQRHEKHEESVGQTAERPPGEEEDHDRPRAAEPEEALHARLVDRDVVDHRSGEVEGLPRQPGDPPERGTDPGHGGTPVGEASAGEGDHEAGCPAVGSDEDAAESLHGLVTIERQRRIDQARQCQIATGDRLEPGGSLPVPRRRAGRGGDEVGDLGSIECAAVPGGDDDVAALEFAGEFLVGRPGGKRRRDPLHRRRGIDPDHTQRRWHHPGGDSQKAEKCRYAHRKQPRPCPARAFVVRRIPVGHGDVERRKWAGTRAGHRTEYSRGTGADQPPDPLRPRASPCPCRRGRGA